MPEFKYNIRCLIQLTFLLLAILACKPENDNNAVDGGNQNNPDELTITGEAFDITDYSATITGYANLPIELGNAEVGIMYDANQSFDDSKKVVATELDGKNMFTVTAVGLSPSTTYYYKSYVKNGMAMKYGSVKSFTTKEFICPAGAVDLGIVMTREDKTTYKLYWAKSNLCESGLCANPEDYGDYYAWGETEPFYAVGHSQDDPCDNWRTIGDRQITGYYFSSYKFTTSGEYFKDVKFSKYNYNESYGFVDNITELQRGEKEGETVDDAARAILSGKWRMPTTEEWTALIALKLERTTQNGIVGCLVTASNGNSIFLPTAGYRCEEALSDTGVEGYYWSSSLDMDYPFNAEFASFEPDEVRMTSEYRSYGFSIRPVTE